MAKFDKETGIPTTVIGAVGATYGYLATHCLYHNEDQKYWIIANQGGYNDWTVGKITINSDTHAVSWNAFTTPTEFNISKYYYGFIPSSTVTTDDGEVCYLVRHDNNTMYAYKVGDSSIGKINQQTLYTIGNTREFIADQYNFNETDAIMTSAQFNNYVVQNTYTSSNTVSDAANAAYVTSSRVSTECMIAGSQNQFLVVTKGPDCGFSNTVALMNQCYVMVYLRKSQTDPFDLELKYFKRMGELPFLHTEDRTSNFKKINSNKFLLNTNFGYAFANLDDATGEFEYTSYRNGTVSGLGFDEMGRIYHVFTNSTDIEMLTEDTSSVVEISYEDVHDKYFKYSSTPVYKTLVVKTKNIYGKYNPATFELNMLGRGTFAESGTQFYKGKTGEDGTLKVRVIIQPGGRIKVAASTTSQGGVTFLP